jgi:energy-converting hydrogenase Eha subunit A
MIVLGMVVDLAGVFPEMITAVGMVVVVGEVVGIVGEVVGIVGEVVGIVGEREKWILLEVIGLLRDWVDSMGLKHQTRE